MISLSELRQLQGEFESFWHSSKKHFDEIEKKRIQFIKLFPISSLPTLPMKKYVIGEIGEKNSFCYWIERGLDDIGSMRGANAFKFGIYYGRTKTDPEKKYRFQNRFGQNKEEAYQDVRNELVRLLESGQENNIPAIKSNRLSSMFKEKILSVYYPDTYLNVYSYDHLSYFLEVFGLPSTGDVYEKRERITYCKNSDKIMMKWPLPIFGHFLYYSIKKPVERKHISAELHEYVDGVYIPIQKVKYKFPKWEYTALPPKLITYTEPKTFPEKTDYEAKGRQNRLIGSRGEEIVIEAEKDDLKKKGRADLANKVERVSDQSDRFGYDVLSYDTAGNEKHIEVKATSENIYRFFLTANEYTHMQEKNYEIYIVANVLSKNPQIYKIGKISSAPQNAIRIEPHIYKVEIGVKTLDS